MPSGAAFAAAPLLFVLLDRPDQQSLLRGVSRPWPKIGGLLCGGRGGNCNPSVGLRSGAARRSERVSLAMSFAPFAAVQHT
jgi:hypothetical protein